MPKTFGEVTLSNKAFRQLEKAQEEYRRLFGKELVIDEALGAGLSLLCWFLVEIKGKGRTLHVVGPEGFQEVKIDMP